MQSLSSAIKLERAADCAREILDTAPALIWYIRMHMRKQRQGLSVPQFRALVKVRNEPAASLSKVAEHLGSSLPTASRIVSNLVARGFLTRATCADDRRQVIFELTPRGRSLVSAAVASTQAQMEKQLAGLSAEEGERVRQAMIILRDIFESLGFPAKPNSHALTGNGSAHGSKRIFAARS